MTYKKQYIELREDFTRLLAERKEVGAVCDRIENGWKAYATENQRIHKVLEKLCEARHSVRQDDADFLCGAVDAALMKIWGNTVGPKP